MHRAALPFRIREHFRGRFQEAQVLVRSEQPYAFQTAFLEAYEEAYKRMFEKANGYKKSEIYDMLGSWRKCCFDIHAVFDELA